MTELPPKLDPETLVLRGRPRRVVRFKRNVLVGVAAVGCVALAGLTWLGLRPPAKVTDATPELYAADKAGSTQKAKPERLQSLPKTYADAKGIPVLGPPLPGDIGKPLLEAQQTKAAPLQASSPTVSAQAAVPGLFYQVKTGSLPASETTALSAAPGVTGLSPVRGASIAGDGDQARKLAFTQGKADGDTLNAHVLQEPASPYQVMAGTVISASLVTGLNSDLPGTVIAQVTEPVYDTVSGTICLIPQGTRLIGAYDSSVSFGQSRVLLVWKRLIMPDGTSLEIDNFPAADKAGYTGLKDGIDAHTWSLLRGVGLSTLLGLTAVNGDDGDSDLVKAFREASREAANQAGQAIVQKALTVQPSLTVRPGWPVRVIVSKDLIMKAYWEVTNG